MTTYKVWLTVKDRYGNTKEVDGGNISIKTNLDIFSEEAIDKIEEALPLEEYVKLNDLETRLESYATDEELAQETKKVEEKVEEKVTEVVEEKENIRYGDFELRDE